ncbi:MAG TPA: glycosyltransferase family 2 protein [Rickettsiales bacterium]|nr:glycosyltransferase family 2 protein [Rickettsiales bacterium]
MIEISVVIPMFNESEVMEKLFARLKPCIEQVTTNYEIVCVNDGSRDDTLLKLREFHRQDPRIKVVHLSRNFGKEAALTAGIDYTVGRVVIPIDADLQDPPEMIPQMIAKWKEGYKVVLATRRSRPTDSWLKRKSAGWFYRAINAVSTVKIPPNTGDYRLMDRQVVDAVKRLPERTRFMKGIFAFAGFSTTTIYFDRESRAAGTTSWNYWGLWKFALEGIFSFTTVPLHIWTYMGAVISLVSFFWALEIIVKTMIFGNPVHGYASTMVAVLFMGGVQLLSIGIIGEYVGRIFTETKHRPVYLVEETLGIQQ